MSLRKQAKILGISPPYLSLLLNGKRPWRGNLKERYQELVNTFVNIAETNTAIIHGPNGNSYLRIGGRYETRTPDSLLAKHGVRTTDSMYLTTEEVLCFPNKFYILGFCFNTNHANYPRPSMCSHRGTKSNHQWFGFCNEFITNTLG